MKANKSQIMKAAWAIKKDSGVKFSTALKAAWCKAKNDVEKVFDAAGLIIPIFTKGQEIFLSQIQMISPYILKNIITKDGYSNPSDLHVLYTELLDTWYD